MCLGLKPMDELNIDAIRADLKSADTTTCYSAIRMAIDAIPNSAPLLGDLYLTYLSTDSDPCASAAHAAIRRHKSVAVPFLLKLLYSQDCNDRQNAIHLLLGLGHNRSSYRIYEQILDDRPDSQPDWGPQRELVIDKLNDTLNDPDSDVRTLAAITLDDIHETPDSIVSLLIAGLDSDNIYIQNMSALHLGRLGPPASDALPALTNFVESNIDPTDGARRPVLAAKHAINRINGP